MQRILSKLKASLDNRAKSHDEFKILLFLLSTTSSHKTTLRLLNYGVHVNLIHKLLYAEELTASPRKTCRGEKVIIW